MQTSKTMMWSGLVKFTVLTSCLAVNRAEYHDMGRSLTFCDAVQACQDLGGNLPGRDDARFLKEWLIEERPHPEYFMATWLLQNVSAAAKAQKYCESARSPAVCPGLVGLPTPIDVLKPPLANCTHSSVDIAVCQPRPVAVDGGMYSFPMRERGRLHTGRPGSYCDAINVCTKKRFALVISHHDQLIRTILGNGMESGCWATTDVTLLSTYCVGSLSQRDKPPRECPGQIILRQRTQFVPGRMIGCDVPLPVICELPPSTTSSIQSAATTDVTPTRPETETITTAGLQRNVGSLPFVLGIVGGFLFIMVIIIIVVVILVKKKSSEQKRDSPITEGHDNPTYNTDTHDIISGTADPESGGSNEAVGPHPGRRKPLLPTAPPHIEGYSVGVTGGTDVLPEGVIATSPVPPESMTSVQIDDVTSDHAKPIKPVPADDAYPEEGTLVENTLYG